MKGFVEKNTTSNIIIILLGYLHISNTIGIIIFVDILEIIATFNLINFSWKLFNRYIHIRIYDTIKLVIEINEYKKV